MTPLRVLALCLLALSSCRAVKERSVDVTVTGRELNGVRMLRIDSLRTRAVHVEVVVTETLDTAGRVIARSSRTAYSVKDSISSRSDDSTRVVESVTERCDTKRFKEKAPGPAWLTWAAGAFLLCIAAVAAFRLMR